MASSVHLERKMEAYCVLVFAFTLAVFMILSGLIFIFNKDQAWRIQEWSLRIVRPQRTPEWEATIRGVILLVFGSGWFLVLLYLIFH
jgi:hypothetical protein